MAEVTPPIRVLIADDDQLVRSALVFMLADVDDITVVAGVSDGSEVAAAVDTHAPHVVLMDIRMPNMDGLHATELLRARSAPPEVIILTTFDLDDHVVRALRAGASGFVVKDTPPAEIVHAIRSVASGQPMLSPGITRKLMKLVAATERDQRREHARSLLGGLTEREQAVATAIGKGKSNAEIGTELFMSTATVKAYVSRLLTKLDLNNRVQVALLVHDADQAAS